MTHDEICDMVAARCGDSWRSAFALFPRRMNTGEGKGTWVWLTHYLRRDMELGWGCSAHQKKLRQLVPVPWGWP